MGDIEGSMSQEVEVASGVPKGSVLGPIQLISHISVIDAQLQSTTVRTFADDTKLIKKIENENDCQKQQEDLVKTFDHAARINKTFKSGKIGLMRYTRLTDSFEFECKAKAGSNINKNTGTKNRGVFISDNCKFHEQIKKSF